MPRPPGTPAARPPTLAGRLRPHRRPHPAHTLTVLAVRGLCSPPSQTRARDAHTVVFHSFRGRGRLRAFPARSAAACTSSRSATRDAIRTIEHASALPVFRTRAVLELTPRGRARSPSPMLPAILSREPPPRPSSRGKPRVHARRASAPGPLRAAPRPPSPAIPAASSASVRRARVCGCSRAKIASRARSRGRDVVDVRVEGQKVGP
ncbi:hypothetical protein VTO73DRAFT_13839 [Trametes versicolor]